MLFPSTNHDIIDDNPPTKRRSPQPSSFYLHHLHHYTILKHEYFCTLHGVTACSGTCSTRHELCYDTNYNTHLYHLFHILIPQSGPGVIIFWVVRKIHSPRSIIISLYQFSGHKKVSLSHKHRSIRQSGGGTRYLQHLPSNSFGYLLCFTGCIWIRDIIPHSEHRIGSALQGGVGT